MDRNKLIDSIRTQCRLILRKKITLVTYLVLLGFAMMNVYSNIKISEDIHYTSQMYDIVKMLLLSTWSPYGYFLLVYMPVLCVMPTADSWFEDRKSGMDIYLRSRIGKREYWYGKLIAVFSISFLIFSIPLLLELIFSVVTLSTNAGGDPSRWPYFMTVAEIWKYPCFRLFCSHRFIYTIAYILQFSLLFSVLAVVNLSISTIKFMKYRVLLYLPVYFILYLFSLMKEMVKGIDYTTYYVDILQMFVIGKRNNGIYLAVLLLLILFSVLLTEIQIRRKI